MPKRARQLTISFAHPVTPRMARGNPAMAKTMKGLDIVNKETQAKKDDQLLKVIVQGEGKMPASGKNLNKQEQTDLLAYVRSLAK
jgi:hypothetical protein